MSLQTCTGVEVVSLPAGEPLGSAKPEGVAPEPIEGVPGPWYNILHGIMAHLNPLQTVNTSLSICRLSSELLLPGTTGPGVDTVKGELNLAERERECKEHCSKERQLILHPTPMAWAVQVV